MLPSQEKEFYQKLSKQALSEKEVFEAKHNLAGFFDLLYQVDKRCAETKENKRKNDPAKSSAGST